MEMVREQRRTHDAKDTKKILVALAKDCIGKHCKFECIELAEAQGHKAVFTAP